MSGEVLNPYLVRFAPISHVDNTMINWGHIHRGSDWSEIGYLAQMHKDQFYHCRVLDLKKNCIHHCICRGRPSEIMNSTKKVPCRIQAKQGGLENYRYEDLPTRLVPIYHDSVMWSTDPSLGSAVMPSIDYVKRAKMNWKDQKEVPNRTHNAKDAVRQSDSYFRCHYRTNKCIYKCICKSIGAGPRVDCRIEPEDGMKNIDFDSLARISLLPKDANVLWNR